MKTALSLVLVVSSCTLGACAHRHPASARARADVAGGAMVALPGGSFRLAHGSGPAGDLATYVSVRPFLLDATEVTVAAYGECVRAGRCEPAGAAVGWESSSQADRAAGSPSCNRDRPDRADHPVNCVRWDDAASYCAWAGKRLPTEEEWEWAARNGREATAAPWGDAPPAAQPCWRGPGSDAGPGQREGTCAVRSHPGDRTAAGVYDLGGGVAEWTASETVAGADSRGRGGTKVKVFRGGAWSDTDPAKVGTFARGADLRARRDARLGLRCASDP